MGINFSLDPNIATVVDQGVITRLGDDWGLFEDLLNQTPLLRSMIDALAAAGGHIMLNTGGRGTITTTDDNNKPLILLDLNVLQQLANPTVPQTPGDDKGLLLLADALAHELGHATLVNGNNSFSTALNPDQATQIGEQNEGTALTAEYLVARELPGQFGLVNPQLVPDQYSDPHGNLSASLSAALADLDLNEANIESVDVLDASQFLTNARNIAGPWYATNGHPSNAPNLNYGQYWVFDWFMLQGVGLGNSSNM
jgi:hypothetical protein